MGEASSQLIRDKWLGSFLRRWFDEKCLRFFPLSAALRWRGNESLLLEQETIKRRKLSFSFCGANLSFRKTETLARSCFNRKEETTYKLFIVLNFQASQLFLLAHCSIGKVLSTLFPLFFFTVKYLYPLSDQSSFARNHNAH